MRFFLKKFHWVYVIFLIECHRQAINESNDYVFVNNACYQDRDGYIDYLECKIEGITDTCLDFRSLSDRVEQIQVQIDRIEDRLSTGSTSVLRDTVHVRGEREFAEMNILKQRLLRLEQRLDLNSPAIAFPHAALGNRVNEVEINCARMAADTFAAVESMHEKLESLQEAVRKDFLELDKTMRDRLDDSISQVSILLSKLLDAHKSMIN